MTKYNLKAPRPSNSSPIEKARIAKGMTQKQLAEAIGVEYRQISLWERCSIKPAITTLIKISNVLDVDINTLIGEWKRSEPNNYIVNLRKEKGLTQAQLAQMTGITQTMIQKYETGATKASDDVLEKIANALEVDVSCLVKDYVQSATTLADYRKNKRVSQKQLAEMTGVSPSTIANYEAGRTTPSEENIEKIATALNIPIESLAHLTQKESNEEISDSDSNA